MAGAWTSHQEEQTFRALEATMGAQELANAGRTLERLRRRFVGRSLGTVSMLLPFSGGKDSAWALAYARVVQLLALKEDQTAFHLHVLIVRHPGMSSGAVGNIIRALNALGIPSAPLASVHVRTPAGQPSSLGRLATDRVEEAVRQEILVSGHLSRGGGRETFCYSCNFHLAGAILHLVRELEGRLDLLVTGDSIPELRSYRSWVRRCLEEPPESVQGRKNCNGSGLLESTTRLAKLFYEGMFGPAARWMPQSRSFFDGLPSSLAFPDCFSLFQDTEYEFGTHRSFLESHLGFQLVGDDLHFTESDCCAPTIMAHLRGLRAELLGHSYKAGVTEYVGFATRLMEEKKFPEGLIHGVRENYNRASEIERLRARSEELAKTYFDLEPDQMTGIVASPITDGCARTDSFLRMLGQTQSIEDDATAGAGATRLSRRLGLEDWAADLLRRLPSLSLDGASRGEPASLEAIRFHDPHAARAEDDSTVAGALITGR